MKEVEDKRIVTTKCTGTMWKNGVYDGSTQYKRVTIVGSYNERNSLVQRRERNLLVFCKDKKNQIRTD